MATIAEKYAELGRQKGFLGKPLNDEDFTLDKVGRYRFFENGAIYWHPDHGAHVIYGELRQRWNRLAFEAIGEGLVNLTTQDGRYLRAVKGGGSRVVMADAPVNKFDFFAMQLTEGPGPLNNGDTVYLQTWNKNYLTIDEAADGLLKADSSSTDAAETFEVVTVKGPGLVEVGSHIALKANNGKFLVVDPTENSLRASGEELKAATSFAIHFVGRGFKNLGYPTIDQSDTDDGQGQYIHFENGAVYLTPKTGAHEIRDEILEKWQALQESSEGIGYPISDQFVDEAKNGKYAHFEYGSIYWTAETGAHDIRDEIRAKWDALSNVTTPFIYLKSSDSRYLAVAEEGDEIALGDGTRGPCETFILSMAYPTVDQTSEDPLQGEPDFFYLKTVNGRYLSIGEDGTVTAQFPDGPPGDLHKFEIVKVTEDDGLGWGDWVALKSKLGDKYLGAEPGGDGTISATAETVGVGEIFVLEYLGGGEQGALGYPVGIEITIDGKTQANFESGSISLDIVEARLTFFQQNMSLLPFRWAETDLNETYPGLEGVPQRQQAIDSLIAYLQANTPDIVGLTECFDALEREEIKTRLQKECDYRHCLEGPQEGEHLDRNSGLFLLSRYPISKHNETIYRHYPANSPDLTNRGVLHALIEIPEHPTGYDIFLTQTQRENVEIEPGKMVYDQPQLDHLYTFIQAYSSPDRPALLIGDLDTDAFDGRNTDTPQPGLFLSLLKQLRPKVSLWQTDPSTGKDITANDPANSFASDPTETERRQTGTRPDYFLGWFGNTYEPIYGETVIEMVKTALDRDISDHYGLKSEQTHIRAWDITIDQNLEQVTVEFIGFHCLTKTPSLIDTAEPFPDLPFFEVVINSAEVQQVPSVTIGDDGTRHNYESPQSVQLTPDENPITIRITGSDQNPLVDLANPDLKYSDLPHEEIGTAELIIEPDELMILPGRSKTRVLPLLKGDRFLREDGGEYAAVVRITVV